MKSKKRITICTLGIVVLMGILYGTGIFRFSFNKGEISTSITGTWNNTKSMTCLNGSNKEITSPSIPVIVIYKDIMVGDLDSLNPIKIDISDKDFGIPWLPFIKKSDYNFSIQYNNVHEIKTKDASVQFKFDGKINVSGHYNCIGLYSTETATKMIVDNVLENIYNHIKDNIK